MKSFDKKHNEEYELQKALAVEVARPYCEQNGLSVDKLLLQQFYLIYGEAFFAQPSDIEPDGLCNDIDTQPKPTLVLKKTGTGVLIQETEHTKRYLVNEFEPT